MIRAQFTKTDDAVWISHLDLMRVLQRAFRRGGMLLKHSQGFTPHPCLSIAMPLSVGTASVCELMDFELAEGDTTLPAQIKDRLNASLPAGVQVLDCYDDGRKMKELKFLQAVLTLEYDAGVPQAAVTQMEVLFAQPSLPVEKHGKNGPVQTDIAPMLQAVSLDQTDANTVLLKCTVCAQNPTLNPLLLGEAIRAHLPQAAPDFYKCCRIGFLDAQMQPFR